MALRELFLAIPGKIRSPMGRLSFCNDIEIGMDNSRIHLFHSWLPRRQRMAAVLICGLSLFLHCGHTAGAASESKNHAMAGARTAPKHLEVQPPEWTPETSTFQLEKYVPPDIAPESDQAEVSRRIMDRSMQTLLSSDIFKKSALLESAKGLEETMKTDVTTKTVTASGEVIEHKVSFIFEAFQQKARMRYTGLLNADIQLFMDSRSQVELNYPLTESSQVGLQTTKDHLQDSSQLTFRMSW